MNEKIYLYNIGLVFVMEKYSLCIYMYIIRNEFFNL